jgi:acetyl esterase/lipase
VADTQMSPELEEEIGSRVVPSSPPASSGREGTYVTAQFPPTLLLTGNRDELVDWGESVRLHEALLAAGARSELHVFDGVPHAFDLLPEYGRLSVTLLTLFLDTHVLHPRELELPL